jgi:hypothetical protein
VRWLLAFVLLGSSHAAAAAEEWKEIASRSGVSVSALELPGRTLPVLRAVTTIDAGLYEVMAVIYDVAGHPEWVEDCAETRVLRRDGETVAYFYNRTSAPWPVSDRDVVMRSEMRIVVPGVEIRSSFRSTDEIEVAPRRGVVRTPRVQGHYRLEALGDGGTRVEYELDADPGGRLPGWLVARTSRDMPLHTLIKLHERVRSTRGHYDAWLERWDPSRRDAE